MSIGQDHDTYDNANPASGNPCLSLKHVKIENYPKLSGRPKCHRLSPYKRESQGNSRCKGDGMLEAEIGVMKFKDGERFYRPEKAVM